VFQAIRTLENQFWMLGGRRREHAFPHKMHGVSAKEERHWASQQVLKYLLCAITKQKPHNKVDTEYTNKFQ
jgi:hypothetical protein